MTTGLSQATATALRDVILEHLDSPARACHVAFDAVTEERCTPWYRLQVDSDRVRFASVQAAIEGRELPGPPADDPIAQMQVKFGTAATYDADVARAFLDMMACLALPHEVLARPGMIDKVLAALS